jgi:hypothetical protein
MPKRYVILTEAITDPAAMNAYGRYESAAYEEAKPLRLSAADTNAVIVSGFEMPPPRV